MSCNFFPHVYVFFSQRQSRTDREGPEKGDGVDLGVDKRDVKGFFFYKAVIIFIFLSSLARKYRQITAFLRLCCFDIVVHIKVVNCSSNGYFFSNLLMFFVQ